jgi:glutamyl-tRNA reductase
MRSRHPLVAPLHVHRRRRQNTWTRSVRGSRDIVISGTSAPHAIIKKEHISQSKSLILFDLAVPADADTEVQSLANIQYYNLKRIEQQVNGNKSVRAGEVVKAELIIEQEISRFMEYQNRYFLNKQQLLKASETFNVQAV